MAIELVTSACCLPELGRAELFAAAQRAGYAGVELFFGWTSSRASLESETPEAFRGAGVRVTALHLPGKVDEARQAIALAARADIPKVIAHGHGKPAEAGTWLRPLAGEARARGVDLVLTNHKGQSIESPGDVAAALEACGEERPGVLLEAGHYWAAGHDPRAALAQFAEQVRLVHLKDLDRAGRSVPFGEGVCDVQGFCRDLAGLGYAGRVVAELELKDAPPAKVERFLAEGRVRLAEWLGLGA